MKPTDSPDRTVQIEVTEEMIQAGVAVIRAHVDCDLEEGARFTGGDDLIARDVLKEMLRVYSAQPQSRCLEVGRWPRQSR